MPVFIDIDVIINDPDWRKLATVKRLEKMITQAVEVAVAKIGVKIAGPAELAIVLASNQEQQALNLKWRSKDQPTNVLSFPLLPPFSPISGLMGDIVLARETVLDEAKSQQKNWDAHLVHLVVHGFLHILGYDHQIEIQATEMENLEINILSELGMSDPYRETSGA